MKHPAQPLAATAFMLLTLFATATLAADSRETRPVAGFSGIDLGVPAKLEIIQGETESLALQGPADVLADIETIVRNDGVLLIRKRTRGSWPFHTEVRIVVNAKRVESVAIAGSGDIFARTLRSPKLTLVISGSGEIHVPSLETESALVAISGSGDVRIAGRATNISSTISGSGDVKAEKLETRKATVNIAGAGDVALWVRDSLAVKIAGSGDVRYYGDPSIEKRIMGSGSVKRLGSAPS